ncbi:hypothetical protein KP509_07G049500 [Ceratopteris richardii]|uniref:Metallo-beta-lactamase domain-containing protein n=1 Tax=Ceratopteris richardii TaxID=49495 RepID=A0A8T2UL12_CERRI|nr:hypothetical protein KP509_07G049500 [Ceratopteris richardii]
MTLRLPVHFVFTPLGNTVDVSSPGLCRRAHNIRCSSGKSTRRPQNVEGEFYVDRSCIDCDVCRWMAPNSFKRVDGQSAVYKQPKDPRERLAALQALLSCPTASIRTETPPSDILEAHATFPIPINEESIPGVYHCGYHSEKSFASSSYFIRRTGGNILVDRVMQQSLCGCNVLRDDVADHNLWQKHFKCPRIIHELEVTADTANVEIKLEGSGPWDFLGPDIDLIFTPGHTEGSVCLHLKPLKVLFTGDHLANSGKGFLNVDPIYNWYSGTLKAVA